MIPASIFIASSSEGLPVARAVEKHFNDFGFEKVTTWKEGIFEQMNSYLESLDTAAHLYDYGIFCLTSDDVREMRSLRTEIPRDNVLFELGLFMGRSGRKTAFILAESTVTIPSDFDGITINKYITPNSEDAADFETAVVNPCKTIKSAIQKHMQKSLPGFLPSTALAFGYFENFVRRVVIGLLDDQSDLIDMADGNEPIKLEFSEFNLKILIPTEISLLVEPELLRAEVKHKVPDYKKVQIQTSFRGFPFFISGDFEPGKNQKLQLFDIPTTIRSSSKIIEFILNEEGFGDHEEDIIAFEKKEIKNFKNALEFQIRRAHMGKYITVDWL